MFRLGIIVVVGIFVDILIWPVTSVFWSEYVHNVFLEQKVDAGWALSITWTLFDGMLAVLIMGGFGFMLALGTVSWIASQLGRR